MVHFGLHCIIEFYCGCLASFVPVWLSSSGCFCLCNRCFNGRVVLLQEMRRHTIVTLRCCFVAYRSRCSSRSWSLSRCCSRVPARETVYLDWFHRISWFHRPCSSRWPSAELTRSSARPSSDQTCMPGRTAETADSVTATVCRERPKTSSEMSMHSTGTTWVTTNHRICCCCCCCFCCCFCCCCFYFVAVVASLLLLLLFCCWCCCSGFRCCCCFCRCFLLLLVSCLSSATEQLWVKDLPKVYTTL